MKSEIPILTKISGWIWILTGVFASVFIIIQSILTLQSAEFNHSGINKAGAFMIFLC